MKQRTNGLLKKSIKKRVKTFSNGNTVAVVGPDRNTVAPFPPTKSGKRRKYTINRPANISHLVDRGHGGPHPAPAHAFRDPAYQATKETSAAIVKEKMIETLEAEALRMGRR
jgi:hypothetical protein